MMPQVGGRDTVTFPHQMPDSEYLKNLEPLGWIHTQDKEKMQLSPYDVNLFSKLLIENSNWEAQKAIALTVSFTPGSCTLTAYKLTPQGFDWG